jgi:hypothetical protein
MRSDKLFMSSLVAMVFVAMPFSSASAAWHHRGPIGGLADAVGAVVYGAATIATAPFVVLDDIASGGYRRPPPPGYYYRQAPPQPQYYAPPPRVYGPPPPPYYYAPRERYYGPPPGYYRY